MSTNYPLSGATDTGSPLPLEPGAVGAGASLDATCQHRLCAGKGTYAYPVVCLNCPWTGRAMSTRGHEADTNLTCPACGCRRVRVDGAKWQTEGIEATP